MAVKKAHISYHSRLNLCKDDDLMDFFDYGSTSPTIKSMAEQDFKLYQDNIDTQQMNIKADENICVKCLVRWLIWREERIEKGLD